MATPGPAAPGASPTSPFDTIKYVIETNPRLAVLLTGTLGVFAVIAIIASWGIELQANIANVVFVVAIGVVLFIVTRIVSDEFMVKVLKFFSLTLIILWIICFIAHRMDRGEQKWLTCVVKIWDTCESLSDKNADNTPGATPNIVTDNVPPVAAAFQPSNYKVFVQFAGFARPAVQAMASVLVKSGWPVQGADRGGQRTGDAVGLNVIRYSDEADAAAAQALADSVKATGIIKATPRVERYQGSPSIPKGTLEVWISL